MSDASFWGNRKDDRDFLEKCKHDIAERHTFVEGLLDYWEGMMLPEAPRYERGSTNPVSQKRASPADASDSEGQKRIREQGVEEDVLHQCILNPENHGRIASLSIMSALDVLIRHDLILPEETYEVTLPMGKGNPDEACRFLRSLSRKPRAGRHLNPALRGLVVASHNMHVFGPAFATLVDPARYWPAFDAL
ncbi:hypothetical protein Q5P01_000697 [Channa striata]|uniref:Uncharacterized protein n=1 Tax=Channa striata TaxID=64152 RepID=A0AA88IGL8_CHASR|nr:hypothetical protein Q5P01_000697 [Channa striata]